MRIEVWSKGFFKGLLINQEVYAYLERLKEHHAETYSHSMRVGLLCVDLGHQNSLPNVELSLMGYAGVLHDIGKLGIPLDILEKDSPLTDHERKVMNGHPRLGYLELEGFDDEVRQIVTTHHEYKNDAPYPRSGGERRREVRSEDERRMQKDKIHRLGEIVAISDLYDALANSRSYKPGLPIGTIAQILKQDFVGNPEYITQVLDRHSLKRF